MSRMLLMIDRRPGLHVLIWWHIARMSRHGHWVVMDLLMSRRRRWRRRRLNRMARRTLQVTRDGVVRITGRRWLGHRWVRSILRVCIGSLTIKCRGQ